MSSLRSVQGVRLHAERHQGQYKESDQYMQSVTKVSTRRCRVSQRSVQGQAGTCRASPRSIHESGWYMPSFTKVTLVLN